MNTSAPNRRAARNQSLQSNISSTSTSTSVSNTSTRCSAPSTDGGATPRPNPNRPVDWRYHLDIAELEPTIQDLQNAPAFDHTLLLTELNDIWKGMVDDCIENMEVNLKCPTCNEDLPTVRQGKSTRHNISVALNDKIDALVTAMRAVTPQNLTQLQLDDFRNDWWTYEDEYVAENLAANCKGLIGVENRDYSVRDYSL